MMGNQEPAATMPPTEEQFGALQKMFDHFNLCLFNQGLPSVLLNLTRRRGTYGLFYPYQWLKRSGEELTHELSLNPAYFREQAPRDTASTLCHEMCHLWQQEYGRPSRRGYHNQEWAAQMESIGLIPSDTGLPGGKKVGQRMAEYILPGGRFEAVFASLPVECFLPWQCAEVMESGTTLVRSKDRNKNKYSCPSCGVNVWGKPELNLLCGCCMRTLVWL